MSQTAGKKGEFIRADSIFRDSIGSAEYPVESGRYHLYVALACPWATRVMITRGLLGLQDAIDVSVVHPIMAPTKPGVDDHKGWIFKKDPKYPWATGDPINGQETVRGLYDKVGATETRFTVPTLWDKNSEMIVNNESKEMIRFLYDSFNASEFAKTQMPYKVDDAMGGESFTIDLYPEALRETIDSLCDKIYNPINNGVYRCGFAQSQEAYDIASRELFDCLDEVEEILM